MSGLPHGRPFYFGLEDAPIFGWWHWPRGLARRVGVVVCSPFGREEMSAHRSVRQLANLVASGGQHVVRFDYPGCGDSAGDEDSADLVEQWIKSIGAAADELKRLSGVSEIALVGLRLGAALAIRAASMRTDVVGFVAWSPTLSGRSFVRELTALQAASTGTAAMPASAGRLESGGFALSAETTSDLSALDVRALPKAPAGQMLVIDRDDMPGQDRWVRHLDELGAKVRHVMLPGYVEMMLDPHETEVPVQMLSEMQQWLMVLAARASLSGVDVESAPRGEARFESVSEEPVCIPFAGGAVQGVLSRPIAGSAPNRGVLLLNAGAMRRIGPSRVHVVLARRLAAQGHAVLRLDLTGLGDSERGADAADNVVYSPSAIDEVAEAVAYLRRTVGVECCDAIGVCSGAYHSFKAAARGVPLDGVVAINPLTFSWRDGQSLSAPVQDYEAAGSVSRSNLLSPRRWSELLRGKIAPGRVVMVMWHWARGKWRNTAREFARLLNQPLENDLARELETIVARQVDLRFVFSEGEPGPALLREQGGLAARRMARNGKYQVRMIAGADHTFTNMASRDVLLSVLAEA